MDESRIRAKVFEVVRTILDIPSSNYGNPRNDLLGPQPIESFRRIDPVFLLNDQKDWWLYNFEEYTPDVLWPIDTAVVGRFGDEKILTIIEGRSITPKEARGYADRFSPRMMYQRCAYVENGKWITDGRLFSLLGGKWVDSVKPGKKITTKGDKLYQSDHKMFSRIDSDTTKMLIGVSLRHRYEWSTCIGFHKSPSVRFATDPTGIKELFRLRDVPDGKDRRDALMTWVSDHWRQKRRDPEIETYVRKHLRGSTKFDWRGMECEIVPAAFDVDMRDKLVEDRAALRDAGADQRLKNIEAA